MTKLFTSDSSHGECYKVNFTDSTMTGKLIQSIGNTPIDNTYSIGEDLSGTYKTTVYITAVAK